MIVCLEKWICTKFNAPSFSFPYILLIWLLFANFSGITPLWILVLQVLFVLNMLNNYPGGPGIFIVFEWSNLLCFWFFNSFEVTVYTKESLLIPPVFSFSYRVWEFLFYLVNQKGCYLCINLDRNSRQLEWLDVKKLSLRDVHSAITHPACCLWAEKLKGCLLCCHF